MDRHGIREILPGEGCDGVDECLPGSYTHGPYTLGGEAKHRELPNLTRK